MKPVTTIEDEEINTSFEEITGLPECIKDVEIDFEHKDAKVRRPYTGVHVQRPAHHVKKKVFKDQMQAHFERIMSKDFKLILKNVVTQARDGDIQSQKMILDRVIPITKAGNLEGGTVPLININIGSLEESSIDTKVIND